MAGRIGMDVAGLATLGVSGSLRHRIGGLGISGRELEHAPEVASAIYSIGLTIVGLWGR